MNPEPIRPGQWVTMRHPGSSRWYVLARTDLEAVIVTDMPELRSELAWIKDLVPCDPPDNAAELYELLGVTPEVARWDPGFDAGPGDPPHDESRTP